MPFTSTRQAQVCYGKRLTARAQNKRWSWDCDEWLAKTRGCIPTEKYGSSKHTLCGPFRPNPEAVYYEGARGGLYFYADRDRKLKIYVPKQAKAYVKRTARIVSLKSK